MTDTIDPYAVVLMVIEALDRLGVISTVGGSIASSFAGEPRSTVDIDLVAALDESHVDRLVSALSPAFYVDAESLRRAIRTRTSTNLIHLSTLLKVDLFVAGGTVLDAQQLARRQPVDVGGGRVLHVHPPEDILLQKLRSFVLGGSASDRQWRDIRAIVRVQGDALDRAYLGQHAPRLGPSEMLERALSDAPAP